jgi:hypothetical protein
MPTLTSKPEVTPKRPIEETTPVIPLTQPFSQAAASSPYQEKPCLVYTEVEKKNTIVSVMELDAKIAPDIETSVEFLAGWHLFIARAALEYAKEHNRPYGRSRCIDVDKDFFPIGQSDQAKEYILRHTRFGEERFSWCLNNLKKTLAQNVITYYELFGCVVPHGDGTYRVWLWETHKPYDVHEMIQENPEDIESFKKELVALASYSKEEEKEKQEILNDLLRILGEKAIELDEPTKTLSENHSSERPTLRARVR